MNVTRLPVLLLLVTLLAAPISSYAVNDNAGTSAFPFLKINVGARPVSMGGAFTGLANDATALYYNPAGIASMEDGGYIFGYHNYFVDLQSGFVGIIRPVGFDKTLAGYVNYLNYGDMTETDRLGEVVGEFGGGNAVFGLTFAMQHTRQFQFGATAKFIYEKVHDYSATGMAFDVGVRYASDRERYTAGVMIQNLGFQFSGLGEEKDRLPMALRIGGSANFRDFPMLFVSDLIVPVDNNPVFAIGAEYFELKPFYLRIGWNSFGSNYRTSDSEDNWAGLSLGVGFDIDDLGILKHAHLAYSYSPGADLGESHRITLTGGR